MGSEFRFDPDGIRQQGALLAALGDRFGDIYTSLRDDLAQAEGCWGDDDLGTAFAVGFEPHAAQLLANLQAMQESLRDTAQGLIDATHSFQDVDQDSADHIVRDSDERIHRDPTPAISTPQSPYVAPFQSPQARVASSGSVPSFSVRSHLAPGGIAGSSGTPFTEPAAQATGGEQPPRRRRHRKSWKDSPPLGRSPSLHSRPPRSRTDTTAPDEPGNLAARPARYHLRSWSRSPGVPEKVCPPGVRIVR